MVETGLRWFEHVERVPMDFLVRRVDHTRGSQITRGKGRYMKTIRETINKDLETNEFLSKYGI
jgi:hypothetical protein